MNDRQRQRAAIAETHRREMASRRARLMEHFPGLERRATPEMVSDVVTSDRAWRNGSTAWIGFMESHLAAFAKNPALQARVMRDLAAAHHARKNTR